MADHIRKTMAPAFFIKLLCILALGHITFCSPVFLNSAFKVNENIYEDSSQNVKFQTSSLREIYEDLNLSQDYENGKADPESYMNIQQLITSKGYPYEEYTVTTPDGFMLMVQRIPHGKDNSTKTGKPVVFLQHGLLGSAASWVINLANESFGFILADSGFDVWMGNIRGSTYSRRHVSLSPESDTFWAWSMDEMVKYDLPAMINFTLSKTNQSQLFYVGYSQGTFIGFASFSSNVVYSKKIKKFYAFAPVATVGYNLSPLRLVRHLTDDELYNIFGHKDFLPNYAILKLLARTLCAEKYIRSLCMAVMFTFGGIDVKQLNVTRLPVILTHTPAGTSTQNMLHWVQLMRSYKFQKYNFGSSSANQAHYGQDTPPQYNVTQMTVPVELYTGGHDWLADKKDVALLISNLTSFVSQTYMPEYNHFDFIWAMNAPSQVYAKVIASMRKLLPL